MTAVPAVSIHPAISTHPASAPVHYTVQAEAVHAHLFDVSLHIAQPAALQELSLPVWIPGSYLVREFSKNLQGLSATQNAHAVAIAQLGKNHWQLQCQGDAPVTLHYQVSAYDTSVRTAWLDSRRGFFNGTSLFLQVHGQQDLPCSLQVVATAATAHWSLATGLAAADVDSQGWGLYTAQNYDELVDCPVEMGQFWRGEFVARGVPHEFIVAGAAPSFDGARLLADTQKICEAEIDFWHADGSKPPVDRYVFMLNVVDDNYGGLEHRNSTALICGRRDLPQKPLGTVEAKASEGYNTLLGLISHEYFHTWNVKRLRPGEFARYDYSQENHTELLWFFEGFTSYYDDLILRRAGLLDNAQYLKLITRTLNQVLQTPGRKVQSVAQSSFDAWVKYYRQDENTANHTVSYYTKGSLVALCLDLSLRSTGQATLDDVMRQLWRSSQGGPITEAQILSTVSTLGSPELAACLSHWVHSLDDLPLAALLGEHGIKVQAEPAQLAQRLGLRVSENHSIQVKSVLRGGLAEQAGLMAGDEWLALEVPAEAGLPSTRWRLQKLEELALYAGHSPQVVAWVARDKQLLSLPVQLGEVLQRPAISADSAHVAAASNWGLEVQDKAALERWLANA